MGWWPCWGRKHPALVNMFNRPALFSEALTKILCGVWDVALWAI